MTISKTKASVLAKKIKSKKRLLRKAIQRGDKALATFHDMGLQDLALAKKSGPMPGEVAPGVRQLRGGGIAI
ncbi:hypothetical protein [Massilia soli]|uniref:Uncharacterized protein n=1 Tax=Massilia soli TaxID=2792854 RepID=A0ABS7SMG8_9BURK|nr:hypothetical protein [Massilia soli]MBZ2207139.1 hypothetical protein [Massilia soli]